MGARRQPTQLPACIMTRADIKSSAYIYFKKQQAVENKKQLISLTSSGSDLNVFNPCIRYGHWLSGTRCNHCISQERIQAIRLWPGSSLLILVIQFLQLALSCFNCQFAWHRLRHDRRQVVVHDVMLLKIVRYKRLEPRFLQ